MTTQKAIELIDELLTNANMDKLSRFQPNGDNDSDRDSDNDIDNDNGDDNVNDNNDNDINDDNDDDDDDDNDNDINDDNDKGTRTNISVANSTQLMSPPIPLSQMSASALRRY